MTKYSVLTDVLRVVRVNGINMFGVRDCRKCGLSVQKDVQLLGAVAKQDIW